MPRDASTGSVDQMRVRIGVQAAHLDGSHPDPNPVPNEHIVGLDWVRVVTDIVIAIEAGWDAEVEIPYDVKRVTAKYRLADGTSFDNPLGDLHHRDETLEGIGDLSLLGNRRIRDVLLEGDFFRLGIGFTVPTGRTHDDPYELGALGVKHQHIQFGTGTIDPLLRLDYAWQPDRFGADLSFSLHQPLTEGAKGYRASGIFDLAVGPRARVTDWLSISFHYVASYQERAFWHDRADPNSGYLQQGLSIAAPIGIGHGIMIVPTILRTLRIETRDGGDSYEMDWTFGVSIDVSIGAKQKEPTPQK